MSKDQIRQLIQNNATQEGLTGIGIDGVRLFRATQAIPCVPAVYEPSVIAIVSGAKEAVLDGHRYIYDDSRYMCCPMSMPVKAGTPTASAESPLYGVIISLDKRMMTELSMEMENAGNVIPEVKGGLRAQGIRLAAWDDAFADALLRLLQLGGDPWRGTAARALLRDPKGGVREFCQTGLRRGQCDCTVDRACILSPGRADLY